jgi:hypothetical protein
VSFAVTRCRCRKLPLQTGTYLTGVHEFRQSSAMVQSALSSRSPGDENDSAAGVKPNKRITSDRKNGQHSERYDKKKAVCSVFFFLLAADNLVADPLTRVRSWRVQIRPTKETTTTLSPRTLQHGFHYKGRVSRERGVDSEEQHTGCLGENSYLSKRHPIGLMETDGPNVHRHTQK